MVAIMVINYNGLRWLSRCLSTVQNTEYPNFKVYLIDNASVDGSVEYVREKYPSVKIIRNLSNVGFAEAYNKVISQIEAEYVVLLNNDTEVLNPRWLSHLVRVANEEPKVAAVATKMVSMEDHRLLESVGGMGIPYWRGFVDIGREEVDMDQYPDGFEPFAFCGGAALIRKSAFIDAGGFDEKFFLYFEDPDLSWRLRLLGWKVRYASEAKVAHYLGGTTGGREVTPLRLYYCHRNLLRTIIKNCGSSLGWALRNYFLFSFLMIAGFLIYEPRKAVIVLRAIAWNVRNLRTAYACRLRVQSRRKVSEQEILRRMYPVLTRKQPAEHASLRRILNLLFEYGDRRKFQAAIRN
jgi:GT2 family glycosyltransferase